MMLASLGSALFSLLLALVPLTAAAQESGAKSDAVARARAEIAAAIAARDAGDQRLAREQVATALESAEPLAKSDDEGSIAIFEEIDGLAESLGVLLVQRDAREAILAIRQRTHPDEHESVTAARARLARTYGLLGRTKKALELQRAVVAAEAARLPAEDRRLLGARASLASALRRAGELAEARALQEEVVEAMERTLPEEDPELGAVKHNLAVTLTMLGEFEEARQLEEEVLAVLLGTLPKSHPSVLAVQSGLAAALEEVGELEGALALYEEVLEQELQRLPPDHPRVQTCKSNIAGILGELGDLEGALALAEEHLESVQRTYPGGHPARLLATANVATLRARLGDAHRSRDQLEEAVASLDDLLPSDHPTLVSSKITLASVRSAAGDPEGALTLLEDALASLDGVLPPSHFQVLELKLGVARVRRAYGDAAGCAELARVALEGARAGLAPDHPTVIRAMNLLAGGLGELGEYDEALELQREVLMARERALPDGHPRILVARANLACCLADMGRLEEAAAIQGPLVQGATRVAGESPWFQIVTRRNYARTLWAMGDLGPYLDLVESAHAEASEGLPAGHPIRVRAAYELAEALDVVGQPERSKAMVHETLAQQLARSIQLRVEPPRIARAAALEELGRLPLAIASSMLGPEVDAELEAELFTVLANLRVASTSSPLRTSSSSSRAGVRVLYEDAAAARRALNEHTLAVPVRAGEIDGWSEELVRLASERDRRERKVRRALEDAADGVRAITAAEVAGALAEDEAVISYFRFPERQPLDPSAGGGRPDVDSLAAFVISSDAAVHRVDLGPCSELESLALAWRAPVGKPVVRGGLKIVEAPTDKALSSERDVGRELRRRIVDPCLAPLGDVSPRALHLVLDDFLHLLPMDALPMEDSRRLGDVVEVRVDVSVERLARPRASMQASETLVALGGVDFDARGAGTIEAAAAPPLRSRTGRGAAAGSFAALPATQAEVESLAARFADTFQREPTVLLGGDATKAALLESAPRARFLHLATHGWFAPESLASVRDTFMPDDRGASVRIQRAQEIVQGFAPETLCGLALAGANAGVDAIGRVPGILTAEEVATLDLTGCELAVLSACETNVGLNRAGQGIQSLQAALHAAGARSAITSLWAVDDAATRRLMEHFYERLWTAGMGKADALWAAKKAMQDEGQPLRNWTGWVLTGDPD